MLRIVPSILSADFKCLEAQLKRLEASGIQYIHIDVMDGLFVPNISIGFPIIQSIRSCTNMKFDVHLMVENPEHLISHAALAGADSITVHQEACKHLPRTINQIKEAGCKVGVSLNPATIVETLKHVIDDVDQVLLMTVNPGFGGQKFIPNMMYKIKECRELIDQTNSKAFIEIDGGITVENAKACIQNGATRLVAGSSVFKGNIEQNLRKFAETLNTL